MLLIRRFSRNQSLSSHAGYIQPRSTLPRIQRGLLQIPKTVNLLLGRSVPILCCADHRSNTSCRVAKRGLFPPAMHRHVARIIDIGPSLAQSALYVNLYEDMESAGDYEMQHRLAWGMVCADGEVSISRRGVRRHRIMP